jgi:two-component system phosphate regulon sensor histidine kinase PhoR
VVANCVSAHEQAASAKEIGLEVQPSEAAALARADEEGLRTILDNLVDNAIKYTPAGGRVIIRWQPDEAEVVIEVEDTGIGIGESHRSRIFERFYRVDRARSRQLGGTGLGLSIVKHLAQAFGGSVAVSSEIGEGSTFSVRLSRP